MNFTPRVELYNRIKRFQELLVREEIEGAIITQNADLFYFAGTIQSSHLYIPATGEPLLMTRRVFERAQKESALNRIIPLTSIKALPDLIKGEGYQYPGKIGLELDVLPVNNYFFYQKVLAPAQLADVSNLIKEVRAIKSAYEVGLLRKAAALIDEVYAEIPTILKEGITEVEAAGKIEELARRKGHQGLLRMRAFNQETYFGQLLSGFTSGMATFFDGPVGGMGLSSAHPQSASSKQIKVGEPILVDYLGVKDGYTVDLTRIYALGFLPDNLREAYQQALEIEGKLIDFIKVGETLCDEVYEYALQLAKETPYAEYFMGYQQNQVKFVGHGVGIELDEWPILAKGFKKKILPGMVIAIEPKFTFPEQGGVGIENTWVVGEKRLERLTLTPDNLVII